MTSTKRKLLLGVMLLALLAGYVLFQKGISGADVWEAVTHFGPGAIALAFTCVLLQNFFLVFRIWALFPGRVSLGLFRVAHGVIYGQLVNTFVPARAGDVLKAAIFTGATKGKQGSDPAAPQITWMTSAGVIIADKVVDITALILLILVTGAYRVPGMNLSASLPTWSVVAAGAGLLVALVAGYVLIRDRIKAATLWFQNFKQGLGGLVEPRRVLLSVFIGLGAWTFEAIALQILCGNQGVAISIDQAVFLLFVLNLAIAIPVSLANLGTFEASLVFGLGTLSVATAPAIAIATVHHCLQLAAIATWAGVIALIRLFRAESGDDASAGTANEFRVQLEDKVKALDYFEKVSADYDGTVSKGILKIPRDRERAAVLKFAKLGEPGTSLIDVGCGAGFYALEGKRAGMYVHAVDASAGMVMRLSGKVDEAEVADIEKLECDRTFDRVVCAGVLDFVMNPEIAFRNICRLVSPTGRLVVLVPRKGPGGLFYRVEKYFFGIHINLYTVKWLERLAKAEGLKLVDYDHPLPTNMAVLFERDPQSTKPLDTREETKDATAKLPKAPAPSELAATPLSLSMKRADT